MTEEEAENIRQNLWVFRIRRCISRRALTSGIMTEKTYRESEYGHVPIDAASLDMLLQKHGLKKENLLLPPNYASLLDHSTRKLIEYSRIHLTVLQRNLLNLFLRNNREK